MSVSMRFLSIAALLTGSALAQAPATPEPATPAPPAVPGTPGATQVDPNAPQPEIYSEEPIAELGEIMQGEIKHHVFVVGNRGKAPLDIFRVNPTCGCTIAHVKLANGQLVDPKTLPEGTKICTLGPGEKCEVETDFNSTGQQPHKLEKTIVVISSDNKNPALQLTMRVDIQKVVSVEPNPVQFGEITRGAKATQRAWIKLLKAENVEITGFQDKPEFLDVKWEKATAPDGVPAIALDITLKDDAPTGYITNQLVATTNHPKIATVQIQIYAQIRSEVTFDTGNPISKERLDFGVLDAGKVTEKEITIQNGNPAVPYKVTSIEVDSAYKDNIKAELLTVKEGETYKVKVTTDDKLTARFFRGQIKIKADHPDLKEKAIDFHGWVKKA